MFRSPRFGLYWKGVVSGMLMPNGPAPVTAGCAGNDTGPWKHSCSSTPRLVANVVVVVDQSTGHVERRIEHGVGYVVLTSATPVFGRQRRPWIRIGYVMPCAMKCELS